MAAVSSFDSNDTSIIALQSSFSAITLSSEHSSANHLSFTSYLVSTTTKLIDPTRSSRQILTIPYDFSSSTITSITKQFFHPSSHILSSSISASNTSTTTITPPSSSNGRPKILLYVGIPAVLIGLVLLSIFFVKVCKWYKRRKLIQKEFTPCYTYDHSENEVVDGVLYPSGTNSLDFLTVDTTPPIQRDLASTPEDNDKSCLLGNIQEFDDFASDTKRCESVAV